MSKTEPRKIDPYSDADALVFGLVIGMLLGYGWADMLLSQQDLNQDSDPCYTSGENLEVEYAGQTE